jgi:type VI secretion system secreted protein Hcp
MAAVDYFLKLDGVDGESQDKKYKSAIDVESWSWGETNAGSSAYGGGAGAGKVSMQDFHFVMKVNKASPTLALMCANGKHIGKGVLTCRKAGEQPLEFLTVTMTDLIVSSYQTGGSGAGDIVPTDQISLNFAKIEWEYKMQSEKGVAAGNVKAGWNLKEGVKV